MNYLDKIYVAGHRGLVGSALLKSLQKKGYKNIVYRTSKELDLRDPTKVKQFFKNEKPQYVFLAAAKVGGIVANNTYRADFLLENLQIQNNIISNAHEFGVDKLLFLGSTCIYPKEAPQPLKESYLLTSPLEYTNEPYAIAKIAGIKLCESYNVQYGTNFMAVMPTNLYGPNDNFDFEKSHVLPALVRKMLLAKALENQDWDYLLSDLRFLPYYNLTKNATKDEIYRALQKIGIYKQESEVHVNIWGSGIPRREFLWSEDMADACIHVMQNLNFVNLSKDKTEIRNCHLNIGTGIDLSIKELALIIKSKSGFKGTLRFDTSKPDGTLQKLTDVSRIHDLGWHHKVELNEGIEKLIGWYEFQLKSQ